MNGKSILAIFITFVALMIPIILEADEWSRCDKRCVRCGRYAAKGSIVCEYHEEEFENKHETSSYRKSTESSTTNGSKSKSGNKSNSSYSGGYTSKDSDYYDYSDIYDSYDSYDDGYDDIYYNDDFDWER